MPEGVPLESARERQMPGHLDPWALGARLAACQQSNSKFTTPSVTPQRERVVEHEPPGGALIVVAGEVGRPPLATSRCG